MAERAGTTTVASSVEERYLQGKAEHFTRKWLSRLSTPLRVAWHHANGIGPPLDDPNSTVLRTIKFDPSLAHRPTRDERDKAEMHHIRVCTDTLRYNDSCSDPSEKLDKETPLSRTYVKLSTLDPEYYTEEWKCLHLPRFTDEQVLASVAEFMEKLARKLSLAKMRSNGECVTLPPSNAVSHMLLLTKVRSLRRILLRKKTYHSSQNVRWSSSRSGSLANWRGSKSRQRMEFKRR